MPVPGVDTFVECLLQASQHPQSNVRVLSSLPLTHPGLPGLQWVNLPAERHTTWKWEELRVNTGFQVGLTTVPHLVCALYPSLTFFFTLFIHFFPIPSFDMYIFSIEIYSYMYLACIILGAGYTIINKTSELQGG